MRPRSFILPAAVLLLGIFFPSTGYCYLDPGTGSFVLQVAVAGLLSVLFVVKMFWNGIKKQVKNLFSKLFRRG